MELTTNEIMAIKPYIEIIRKKGRVPQYTLVRKKRVNGEVKRVWSKYLGTAETIEKFYNKCEECTDMKLKSFEYGRTAALMKIAEELNFVEIVNKHTTKKKIEGLTVGEYMLLIILSRADEPISKNGISNWFDDSFLDLMWVFSHKLNTQNFTNHMDYLTDEVMRKIGDDLGKRLVELGVAPTKLYIDMSNIFTYMENGGTYLFNWNNIPGNDSKRLINHLLDNLKIDWVKNATINKNNDDKVITVTEGENSVELKLNEKENKVVLKISGGKTYEYILKERKGALKVYGGEMPKKGRGKEKRYDKNIIGIGIATSDENIPILHESYPGNKHDSQIFAGIFMKIVDRLNKINVPCKGIVVVWDKGCNSKENIEMVKDSEMNIVGALRKDQVPELYEVSLDKYDYLYTNKNKYEVKGYRTKKTLFGQEFTIVMSYNEGSYKKQSRTYEKNKAGIIEKLEKIKQSVERVGKGKKKSIKNALINASNAVRNYKSAFKYDGYVKDNKQVFEHSIDADGEKELRATFGKNPIFTDKPEWDSEKIVKTYNQKDLVEKDFKWLKNTRLIVIKPIFCRDDGHIKVHIFLCVTGLVFYRYLMWKLKKQNETLSETKVIEELEKIRVTLVKKEDGTPKLKFEEMDLDQMRLFSTLDLESVLKEVNF